MRFSGLLRFGAPPPGTPLSEVHSGPIPPARQPSRVDSDIVTDDGSILLDTRVPWYDYKVHPAKRLAYWLNRHLRKIPADWRPYYRNLYRSEMRSCEYVNKPYDVFVCICDGYRKGKWVCRKYGVAPDDASIPRPYGNYYEETTHEERVWAHRRSFRMKELQALQRPSQDVYGSTSVSSNDVMADWNWRGYQANSKAHTGSTVHSDDLRAPTEADISDVDDELTQIIMLTVVDEKSWNPMVRARSIQAKEEKETELFGFEDADDDEDSGN